MLISTLFCFNFNVAGPCREYGVFGAESGGYKYGFQGQEVDNEIKGEGNSVNYKYRMHDPRIGRFFAVDPLTKKYPHYTPYSFSGNKVIAHIELEGLEEYYAADGEYLGKYGTSTEIRIVNQSHVQTVKDYFNASTPSPKQEDYMKNYLPKDGGYFTASVSFEDYKSSVPDVLNDAELVEYKKNCNAAAVKQLANADVEQEGPWTAIQTEIDNEKQTPWEKEDGSIQNRPQLTKNAVGGMIYIMTQLVCIQTNFHQGSLNLSYKFSLCN